MAYYQLIKKQNIPASIDEIWDFISSPSNLKEITPKHMGFEVTGNTGKGQMYPGMIITYKVSPLLGIRWYYDDRYCHLSTTNGDFGCNCQYTIY